MKLTHLIQKTYYGLRDLKQQDTNYSTNIQSLRDCPVGRKIRGMCISSIYQECY